MEKPKARLTIEQHQQAIDEAIWIDASPHEWPTLEKVPLLCNALLDSVVMVDYLRERLAAVEAERDAARAKRDAARAEVAHMKREQQAMIMQHRHDIRDLGQLLQDERCKVATVEAAWYTSQAGEARAVEALRAVVAGSYPHEEDTWTMEGSALRNVHRVLDQYEPTLDNQPPAQQRAEAAAEESWRCFRCGFCTTDYKQAEAHFGDRDEEMALCQWWKDSTDTERIQALQDAIEEQNAARTEAARAVEALKRIAEPPGCGCTPICKCRTLESRSVELEAKMDIATEALGASQPALDWMAQQRREAAVEALKEFADDAGGIEELITCNISDLRSALRARAAALQAGEVGK